MKRIKYVPIRVRRAVRSSFSVGNVASFGCAGANHAEQTPKRAAYVDISGFISIIDNNLTEGAASHELRVSYDVTTVLGHRYRKLFIYMHSGCC